MGISLEPDTGGTLLMRLAHQFGVDEDLEMSKNVHLDLRKLFVNEIVVIEELALTGTVPRAEVLQRQVRWNIDEEQSENERVTSAADSVGQSDITLGPLQIRTFRIAFETRSRSENNTFIDDDVIILYK